jgi:hypothetical protein
MGGKTVSFEAQRQTKSIVYFAKNKLPDPAWRCRLRCKSLTSHEVVGSEHDNTRNAFVTIGECYSDIVSI